MKKLIYGYVTKNYGDDLLIYSFITNDRKSKNTSHAYYLYNVLDKFSSIIFEQIGIKKIKKNLFLRIALKIRLFRKLYFSYLSKTLDELVVVGGSMFIESVESNELYELISAFLARKKSVEILGSNFGPYSTTNFLKKYDALFSKCNKVVFRDSYSFNLFNHNNVHLGTDLAFTLSEINVDVVKDSIGIIPVSLENRPNLKKYKADYYKLLSDLIVYYSKLGFKIKLFGFCEFEGDEVFISEIKNNHPECNVYIYDGDLIEYTSTLSSCKSIISSRFHGVIFSFMANVSAISLSYSNKTKNLIEDLNLNIADISIGDLDKIKVDTVVNLIGKSLPYDTISTDLLSVYFD